MISEAFEYHLQDLENEDIFEYCSLCGSCGCSGCCSPDSCKFMQCIYKEQNLEDYQALLDENEELHDKLVQTLVFIRDKTQMLYPSLKAARDIKKLMEEILD